MTSNQFRAFVLLTAMLAVPFTANAITVDGDLTDLIAASGDINTGGSASESGADAENNGFDITNSYLYFDTSNDTLYGGFETTGPVGNSCTPTGGGICTFIDNGGMFGANETVGISVDIGTLVWAANDLQLLVSGDGGVGTGPDTLVGSVLPGGVTGSWAISESNNGIEFAFSNLIGSGTLAFFSPDNPVDVVMRLTAGGAPNPGPEDEAFVSATLVPIPAAAWLFGSGLLGLAALRRRKAQ